MLHVTCSVYDRSLIISLGYNQLQVAKPVFAQQSGDNSSQSSNYVIPVAVPDWIKNNTGFMGTRKDYRFAICFRNTLS
ncbi:hypothetical protein DYY67_0635 [Candidatus Nitrosotalea sp. TS]|nr:hypothetical protein [Candidatus Nitrosotalea sp. TS]